MQSKKSFQMYLGGNHHWVLLFFSLSFLKERKFAALGDIDIYIYICLFPKKDLFQESN